MIKTLSKTKTLTRSKIWSRGGYQSNEVTPQLSIGNVVLARRSYQVCSQPVEPIQVGMPIMPEGFVTETGPLPDE
jgi:hypothetical protein